MMYESHVCTVDVRNMISWHRHITELKDCSPLSLSMLKSKADPCPIISLMQLDPFSLKPKHACNAYSNHNSPIDTEVPICI
jgi:hypothetical protein